MAETRKTDQDSFHRPHPAGSCGVRDTRTCGRTARWVGVDDRGRPRSLTDADLRRHGWSLTRVGPLTGD